MRGLKKLLALTTYFAFFGLITVQKAWANGRGMLSDMFLWPIVGSFAGAIVGSIKAKPSNTLWGGILGAFAGMCGGGIVKAVIEKNIGYFVGEIFVGFIPAIVIGILIGFLARTVQN